MQVKTILATKGRDVVTVQPDYTVREAAVLMARYNIGAVVVVNETGLPVGILSERDIVRQALDRDQIFTLPVSKVMTKKLITAIPQDDIKSVANTMTQKHIRHLPIVNEGALVGIITIGDIVKAERNRYQGEADTLQTQILNEQ